MLFFINYPFFLQYQLFPLLYFLLLLLNNFLFFLQQLLLFGDHILILYDIFFKMYVRGKVLLDYYFLSFISGIGIPRECHDLIIFILYLFSQAFHNLFVGLDCLQQNIHLFVFTPPYLHLLFTHQYHFPQPYISPISIYHLHYIIIYNLHIFNHSQLITIQEFKQMTQNPNVHKLLSKCSTQQTLASSPIYIPPLYTPQPRILSPTLKTHRRNIFTSKHEQIRKENYHKQGSIRGIFRKSKLQDMRGLSQRKELKKWQNYPKVQTQRIEKILPKDLKIIYYGPLAKKQQNVEMKVTMRRKLSEGPTKQKQSSHQTKEESLVNKLDIQSRYYDENQTKAIDPSAKKINFTYFKMQDKILQDSILDSQRPYKEIILYTLIGLFAFFLILNMIY